jgi:hypothetical protein
MLNFLIRGLYIYNNTHNNIDLFKKYSAYDYIISIDMSNISVRMSYKFVCKVTIYIYYVMGINIILNNL